jgi:hypothetical protein
LQIYGKRFRRAKGRAPHRLENPACVKAVASDREMRHYFEQIVPHMDWREAKEALWTSVDAFGTEGSRKKEKGIRDQILS